MPSTLARSSVADPHAGSDRSLLEYHAIMANAPVGIVFCVGQRITSYNRKFAEMFGFSGEQGVDQPIRVLYCSPEEADAVEQTASQLLFKGQSYAAELRFCRQDGGTFWADASACPVEPNDPKHGVMWTISDIDAKHQAAERLEMSLREFDALMTNASVGILFTHNLKIIRYNPHFGEMFGYAGDAAVGLPVRVLYRSQEEYEAVGHKARPLLWQGKPLQHELFMRVSNGESLWVNLIAYVANPDEPDQGSICILEDRTVQRRAQEIEHKSQVQSEKLAALGSLVAGIAHELNTPIGSGLTTASTLEHKAREFAQAMQSGLRRSMLEQFVSETQSAAELLVHCLSRAGHLVSNFKGVAIDQHSARRSVFDVQTAVAETLSTLNSTIQQSNCRVLSDAEAYLTMDSYLEPLVQVLVALVNNAMIHGFKSGGTNTISIEARAVDDRVVEISVTDNGSGIDPANLSRIFDPFFTTRLGQGGSGLGLHIVHNIVTGLLGGTVEVQSVLGAGARFTLRLPLSAK